MLIVSRNTVCEKTENSTPSGVMPGLCTQKQPECVYVDRLILSAKTNGRVSFKRL